jgi:ABC-type multidrug transport system ATPase subunit/pSer/pThr/pTyr-binding forkhead associated (FHA) protein
MQEQAIILTWEDNGKRHDKTLHDDEVSIGRSPDNDIVLADPRASRYHALISRVDEGYQYTDLGSANGSMINSQRLEASRPYRLRPGDALNVGGVIFQVTLAGAPAAAAAPAAAPAIGPEDFGMTMVAPPAVPGLVVHIGEHQAAWPLDADEFTLGRAPDNDIVIVAPVVSSHHARLTRHDDTFEIQDLGSTNGLALQGTKVQSHTFKDGDELYITNDVRLEFRADLGLVPAAPGVTFAEGAASEALRRVDLSQKTTVTIGRDPQNDIVLDNPRVSRYHSKLERIGQRYRIRDLGSTNGTFVNGRRISGEVWLDENDAIGIGSYRLVLSGDGLEQADVSQGVRVDVLHLQKWVRKDLNLLQDISLCIQPREFVALVGLSGAGKSTLMDALSGFRPATHGAVLVNNTNLYENFSLFRGDIGFVPQRDIIHMELSVYQALDYAARLRLPPDTSKKERHQRVMETLKDLDMEERKDLQVSRLSGGQQKRVSIGVELLTRPGLFFLDEPTSGLDPGTETSLMRLLRRLADQGRTIILITHATKNVMLCDKVIFLVRGGRVSWYGPPDQALDYFDGYRTQHERHVEEMSFDTIYSILEDSSKGNAEDWEKRYKESPAYHQYVVEPLQAVAADLGRGAAAIGKEPIRATKGVSAMRQFMILSSRNLKILLRDKFSLLLMLGLAPLIAALGIFTSKPNVYDPVLGSATDAITGHFLNAIIAVMVGAMASMREIVKEQDIYKRERLVNLKIFPYVASKLWVGALLALYQAGVFTLVQALTVHLPGGIETVLGIYVTLFISTLAGMILGLFISAIAPNANAAPLMVIAFLVPQFMFGGGFLPLNNPVMQIAGAPTISRWCFEALVSITQIGKPIANDPCWQVSEEERAQFIDNDAYKRQYCTCLGANIFTYCPVPGAWKDITEEERAVVLGPPVADPGEKPPEPDVQKPAEPACPEEPDCGERPEQPTQPTTMTRAAQLQYQDDMQAFQDDMDVYQSCVDDWEATCKPLWTEYRNASTEYGDIMADYQDEANAWGDAKSAFGEWKETYDSAVKAAEGLIETLNDKYGSAFRASPISRWLALVVLSAVFLGGTLFAQKRKDQVR